VDAGHQGGAAGLQLLHGLGAIGKLLWMQRSHGSRACLESTLGLGWSASRGCSYVGTPAANRAGWREAEPNRSEARFQAGAWVCVSSDPCERGMTSTGATVATQTERQIVVAVDDSPHSHSAWLWVVENVLRDQDEIILLHGVTTNVRSHRWCTDANPQQATLPSVPWLRAGGRTEKRYCRS
jgi:hypothetical protein